MKRNDRMPRADIQDLGRRLFLIAGSSLALAACGSLDKLVGPPDAPQMYALRPVAPAAQPGGSKVRVKPPREFRPVVMRHLRVEMMLEMIQVLEGNNRKNPSAKKPCPRQLAFAIRIVRNE